MEGVSHFSIRYGCLMLSSCSSCRVADKCMHDLCCVHFSHAVLWLCKVQLILTCINKLSFVTMFLLKAMFPYLHNMFSFDCSNAKFLKRVSRVVGPIQLLVLVQEPVPLMPCDSCHRYCSAASCRQTSH